MAAAFVYAEHGPDGAVDPASLGALATARALGGEVVAVALGAGSEGVASTLGEFGATTVLVDEDAVYDECPGEPAAYALAQLVAEHTPDVVVFGSSYDARDVAGRLQGMLGTALVANVAEVVGADHVRLEVALLLTQGRAGNLRGGIGGSKRVDVELSGPTPRIVLVRTDELVAEPCGGTARVVPVRIDVPESRRRAHRLARHAEPGAGLQLESARVVVAGGRGLEAAENFRLLEELAAAIGNAAVGATRPVVDAGWAPFARQIGRTGKTVSPDVYIAVGISGASQHIVGARGAGCIVAINKDARAPIFQYADLGIVGDALTIVPALVEELAHR